MKAKTQTRTWKTVVQEAAVLFGLFSLWLAAWIMLVPEG